MKIRYIKEVSIYNHDKFSTDKFEVIRRFVDTYLEKHIDLYDMFGAINSFINFKNKEKDNVFEVEGKTLELKTFFPLQELSNHLMSKSLKILHIIISLLRVLLLSEQKKIHKSWRDKALEFRDQGYIIE